MICLYLHNFVLYYVTGHLRLDTNENIYLSMACEFISVLKEVHHDLFYTLFVRVYHGTMHFILETNDLTCSSVLITTLVKLFAVNIFVVNI
jgi:hypothetical protein